MLVDVGVGARAGGGWAVLYWCAMRGGIEDGFEGGGTYRYGFIELSLLRARGGFFWAQVQVVRWWYMRFCMYTYIT